MNINDICTQVERMGWHNKTVLEALALIASEVGEAVNERAEVANQLYQFGLYLDTDGTIKRLTN